MQGGDDMGTGLQGLVSELDDRLGREGGEQIIDLRTPQSATAGTTARAVPSWAAYLLLTFVVLGGSWLLVRPAAPSCSYDEDLCAIERLDIDALRITVPNSRLLATLPSIDLLDPNDTMTTGEILDLERFKDLDLSELLTSQEVDRLLQFLE